jgi:mono/diheme cytochrome c family protein
MTSRTAIIRRTWLCSVALAWGQFACAGTATDLQIVTPERSATFSLPDLMATLQTHTIDVDDPIYKSKKSYDGFRLTDVLEMAGFGANQAADEIIFTALDGYSPSVSIAAIQQHRAYLVFQEHGSRQFEPVRQGKSSLSPGPYYLVWEEGSRVGETMPWPYQLVKIEAARFAEKYPLLYPGDAAEGSTEHAGFVIFKSQCLRCHSINLQGGEIGPELNAPRNVTEYWRPDVLQAFIKDAPAFRFESKMPAFPQLSNAQVASLVSYLRFMAHHKTSRSPAPD